MWERCNHADVHVPRNRKYSGNSFENCLYEGEFYIVLLSTVKCVI